MKRRNRRENSFRFFLETVILYTVVFAFIFVIQPRKLYAGQSSDDAQKASWFYKEEFLKKQDFKHSVARVIKHGGERTKNSVSRLFMGIASNPPKRAVISPIEDLVHDTTGFLRGVGEKLSGVQLLPVFARNEEPPLVAEYKAAVVEDVGFISLAQAYLGEAEQIFVRGAQNFWRKAKDTTRRASNIVSGGIQHSAKQTSIFFSKTTGDVKNFISTGAQRLIRKNEESDVKTQASTRVIGEDADREQAEKATVNKKTPQSQDSALVKPKKEPPRNLAQPAATDTSRQSTILQPANFSRPAETLSRSHISKNVPAQKTEESANRQKGLVMRGSSTVDGPLIVNGDLSVGTKFLVDANQGNTAVGGNLSVIDGVVSLRSLRVTGKVDFSNAELVGIPNTSSVSAPSYVSFALADGSRQTNLTVHERTSLNGDITLGDASTDKISFGGRIESSILPSGNSGGSLGAYGNAWADVFSSGTIHATLLSVTGGVSTFSGNLVPAAVNTYDIGSNGSAWRNIYASTSVNASSGTTSATLSSNGNITLTGNILPASNNASDLGAYGTAFSELYTSGTIYADLLTIAGTGTSTFLGGLQSTSLNLTSASATSTLANGLQLSAGCFRDSSGSCIGGGGANTALSNLASVAINTSLISDAANTDDLGSLGLAWRNIFASTSVNVSSGATSATLSGNGTLTLTGHVLPSSNNASDLGAFSTAFRNLYSSGTAFFTSVTSTQITPWTTNAYDLGSFTASSSNAWRNIFASTSVNVSSGAGSSTISGNGNITLSGHVLPSSNNASDLGAFGTAFRDIYASTSLRVGTSSAASSTLSSGNLSITGSLLSSAVNTSDLGSNGIAFRNLFASTSLNVSSGSASTTISSSGNIVTTGGILPGSNNAVDVGSMSLGLTWRSIFASTSVNVSSGATSATLSSNGNLTLGGATGGGIFVAANNTLDLGADGRAFRNIYVSGTANFGSDANGAPLLTVLDAVNVVVVGGTFRPGGVSVSNGYDLGSAGIGWRNIFASTSLNVSLGSTSATLSSNGNLTLSGHILPASNNASDLGQSNGALRNIYASGTISIGRGQQATSTFFHNLAATGTITASCTGTCIDIAEQITSSEDVEFGDVVAINLSSTASSRDNTFLAGEPLIEKSKKAYSQHVVGVVSTRPGLAILENGQIYVGGGGGDPRKPIVAMVGRVPVKVTNEGGLIKPGDLLVSAATPGHAMKYDQSKFETRNLKPKIDDQEINTLPSIIGVSLEDFSSSDPGKIMMFVRSGYVYGSPLVKKYLGELNISVRRGDLVYKDIDLDGGGLLNIGSLASKSGEWKILENGTFETEGDLVQLLAVSSGTKEFYPIVSASKEITLSGSAKLYNGEAEVQLDPVYEELMDMTSIRITATLTEDGASGLYIASKSASRFIVRELNHGTSNVSFDWILIGTRKEKERATAPAPEQLVQENQGAETNNTADGDSSDNTQEAIQGGVDEISNETVVVTEEESVQETDEKENVVGEQADSAPMTE